MTAVRPEHDATGAGREQSPWFRATNLPQQQPYEAPSEPPVADGAHGAYEAPYEPYEPYQEPYGQPEQQAASQQSYEPQTYEPQTHDTSYAAQESAAPAPAPDAEARADALADAGVDVHAGVDDTMALPTTDPAPRPGEDRPTGGRAERRRAAKARGRRRAPASPPPASPPTASPTGRPMSRVEARRAARAAKDSFGVIASRVVGEMFITFGVVMLLFVTYQIWWTNVQAGLEVDRAKDRIAQDWAIGDKAEQPGAFEAGQGFAILHIPKLDVVVPVAEGIDKEKVLDKGMVGHYAEGALKTAMPSDKEGNFAVAGHRNTHGEPFRYINQLRPGDPIVVETRDAYYTYEMASILPQTPPSNVSVLKPVPDGSGFEGPGRYITLTTCTPEFTSTYRMIVWGKMVEEQPRSKGVPEALAG
ncbi:class E sortase [Streptomyces sp. TRM49041]|uniref:class E sortase n=1 Tax=Streptomyces sp. TRM49041 TaxID=2603216 RepID=UPI0021CCDD76|nr:class E sortase [Streptomyces sp. TRM49041]